jgi:type II secretory pathway component PulL
MSRPITVSKIDHDTDLMAAESEDIIITLFFNDKHSTSMRLSRSEALELYYELQDNYDLLKKG